jgi:hypothetical protein
MPNLYDVILHQSIISVSSSLLTDNEKQYLIEHVMDPDRTDVGIDRFWKHFYFPSSNDGLAPLACDVEYKTAVNLNDLLHLARSIHYLTDVGCILHTGPGLQYHLLYESWLDDNAELLLPDTQPPSIRIDSPYDAVVSLAILNFQRNPLLINAVNDTISYVSGLIQKYLLDIESGVVYQIPLFITENAILLPILIPLILLLI